MAYKMEAQDKGGRAQKVASGRDKRDGHVVWVQAMLPKKRHKLDGEQDKNRKLPQTTKGK
jgi:hypothetical protein